MESSVMRHQIRAIERLLSSASGLVFLALCGCSGEPLTLEVAKQRAITALATLEEIGYSFEAHERVEDARVWALVFRKSQQRAYVDIDLDDGVVYAVKFTGWSDAIKGVSKGIPTLTAAAAKRKAEVIARRFDPTIAFRIEEPIIPAAHALGSRKPSVIQRVKVRPVIDGYDVRGYGCSIEFDRVSGRVLSYAGKWNLPRKNPTPAKPLTLAEAAEEVKKAAKGKGTWTAPKESWLAFLAPEGRPLTLMWFLKYEVGRYRFSYHIDAGTGQVLKTTTYK